MKTSTKVLIGLIMMGLLAGFTACTSTSAEKAQSKIELVNMPTYDVMLWSDATYTPEGDTVYHSHFDQVYINQAGYHAIKLMVDSFAIANNVHPDLVQITLEIGDNQKYFNHVLR